MSLNVCNIVNYAVFTQINSVCLVFCPCVLTLKNAGLKTTQLGLFGNPALGKYWTEHMLGYFDSAGLVKCFLPNMLVCFI